jgi:hypothetical protein
MRRSLSEPTVDGEEGSDRSQHTVAPGRQAPFYTPFQIRQVKKYFNKRKNRRPSFKTRNPLDLLAIRRGFDREISKEDPTEPLNSWNLVGV